MQTKYVAIVFNSCEVTAFMLLYCILVATIVLKANFKLGMIKQC